LLSREYNYATWANVDDEMAYHMPEESGELECGVEEDQVDDGEEHLGAVEPEELVAGFDEDRHERTRHAHILER
jgi:hypothetical protein